MIKSRAFFCLNKKDLREKDGYHKNELQYDNSTVLDFINTLDPQRVKYVTSALHGEMWKHLIFTVFYDDDGLLPCPSCKHELADTFNFCPNCGQKLG